MEGRIRYLVLSPSRPLRETVLGNLFGSFEVSPSATGERVSLALEAGTLEVVGAGAPGVLTAVVERFLARGAGIDGILMLLASGDQPGWDEARTVRELLEARGMRVAVRAFVIDSDLLPDKEGARAMMLALVGEHERLLGEAK
jgi:hypothetical protein